MSQIDVESFINEIPPGCQECFRIQPDLRFLGLLTDVQNGLLALEFDQEYKAEQDVIPDEVVAGFAEVFSIDTTGLSRQGVISRINSTSYGGISLMVDLAKQNIRKVVDECKTGKPVETEVPVGDCGSVLLTLCGADVGTAATDRNHVVPVIIRQSSE